jgi:hypothetical protein
MRASRCRAITPDPNKSHRSFLGTRVQESVVWCWAGSARPASAASGRWAGCSRSRLRPTTSSACRSCWVPCRNNIRSLSRDCRAAEFWQGRTAETTISTPKHTATGQPSRETLEISKFFRSLLRSDTQAGPTRRCPPDGYDVSWMRVSQCNERWRTWEGSTARSQR